MFNKRRLLVFFVDVGLIAAAYVLAFLLRFDFDLPPDQWKVFLKGLGIVLSIKPLVFLVSGLYRNLWRYASLHDAMEIFKVITVSSVMTVFAVMYVRYFDSFPRSIFILDWFLLFSMVSSSRLVWRIFREMYFLPSQRPHSGKRTLILGAGEAGSMLLKEIRKRRDSEYNIIGFVDDDREKCGMLLHRVPVLGDIDHLRALVRKYKIQELIVAIPSAQGKMLRRIVGCCEKAKVAVKTIPGISDIISGKVAISQIKDVDIEDLLGRDAVVLDEHSISSYLTGKKILVSGAAGSIGSEVCRQVARFEPTKIILVDAAETPLFYIEKELAEKHPQLRIIPIVADIRNDVRIEMIFDQFMPEVVFHAAAYKHVPMMEYNPVEAVSNNILGTRKLADAAHRFGVKNFVMISTDKAVNPTNVMGASKRAAEIYVQALARKSLTKFTTVRFGNVLGSNGSVIPVFKEQISRGGPVTVTDPQIMRYFMTIPEATQLVLQAGCIGNGGEIFVLDMGEPVRIIDLAEELIRLSGFIPYEDIDIVITGLRPGEKLFEELLIEGEGIKPTSHEKIKIAAAVPSNLDTANTALDELAEQADVSDVGGIMECLKALVPEFTPSYKFSGDPPLGMQKLRPDLFVAKTSQSKIISLKK
ncbi:nucleoside-diphosphate sugar epimerase/dehydratase [Geobacter sp. DSM 9736]|uniref:polysaccharide biosynthesis protein n=1 Tax=Geobacter sp. DSM 9736 TaxID=1277350 RepID=UPI000B5073BF|nr:nucleoside-diphosphate sugar epimerase/dehydratase [Geobacter sp. DSM 9736]SNB45069.1 NDP-sugar epimerase, includes UDP-GlcNAc-inverting 4,6-dehydratase FlaA1 and capsular polysaccharide biosynthesis protein EpsC [Geobacter sp. DSM 9736]